MKRRAALKIKGHVQGVGFRKNTEYLAKNLNLAGWVKNLDNGNVEILVEGEEKDIEKLIGWANAGPATSRVDQLFVDWQEFSGEFKDFLIIK